MKHSKRKTAAIDEKAISELNPWPSYIQVSFAFKLINE